LKRDKRKNKKEIKAENPKHELVSICICYFSVSDPMSTATVAHYFTHFFIEEKMRGCC